MALNHMVIESVSVIDIWRVCPVIAMLQSLPREDTVAFPQGIASKEIYCTGSHMGR